MIVLFPKPMPKSLLADVGKVYRFFGFELLSPTVALVPAGCDQSYVFMAYKLDD